MERYAAILLLGPTGSGKSPLGHHLQNHGLWGCRCVHFDFGQNLRRIAVAGVPPAGLRAADVRFIERVLAGGALLENETFHIAENILREFLHAHCIGTGDLLVLNGLPRHVGQARDVDRLVDVKAVVQLRCPAAVVRARIRLNAGGDRTERGDDDLADIQRKLDIFHARTLPLLEHYRSCGGAIHEVDVALSTQPEEIRQGLNKCRECGGG